MFFPRMIQFPGFSELIFQMKNEGTHNCLDTMGRKENENCLKHQYSDPPTTALNKNGYARETENRLSA